MALSKRRTRDQYNLEARLEALIHEHLLDMEEHPNMQSKIGRASCRERVLRLV